MNIIIYILLGIWLTLSIINTSIQIITELRKQKERKNIEKFVETSLGDALKEVKKDIFFNEVEELKNKNNKEKGE